MSKYLYLKSKIFSAFFAMEHCSSVSRYSIRGMNPILHRIRRNSPIMHLFLALLNDPCFKPAAIKFAHQLQRALPLFFTTFFNFFTA